MDGVKQRDQQELLAPTATDSCIYDYQYYTEKTGKWCDTNTSQNCMHEAAKLFQPFLLP